MQIPADRLTNLARTIFERGGTDADDAAQVAEKLIEANLFGHDSHGVGMVPSYVLGLQEGQLKPDSELSIELDRGSFLLINGNAG